MSVAKKKSDFRKIEQEDTKKKIELEAKFKPSIKTFLRQINSNFYTQYITNENIIYTREYKAQLYTLLLGMYRKTSKVFKNNIRESFDDKIDSTISAQIDNNIIKNNRQLADLRSDLILATTDREITNEVSNTITQLVIDDKPIDKNIVALSAKKALNNKVNGRTGTIANSEVQTSAEDTKNIEQETLIDNKVILGGIVLATTLKNVWITNLDERTREAHVKAYGQERSPFEKFLVGGEFLAYPGDPSGSAANIIRCRCSKVYKFF